MELISNLKGQFKQQLLLRVRICRSVSLKPCSKNSSTLTSKNAPTGMHQIDPKCLPERLPTSPKSSPKPFPNLSKNNNVMVPGPPPTLLKPIKMKPKWNQVAPRSRGSQIDKK